MTVAPTGAKICLGCKSEIPEDVPDYVLNIIPKTYVTEEVPIETGPVSSRRRGAWLVPAFIFAAIAISLGAVLWFLHVRYDVFRRSFGRVAEVFAPAPILPAKPSKAPPGKTPDFVSERQPPESPADASTVRIVQTSPADYDFVLLGENVRPAALNNAGQVVGSMDAENGFRAFLWSRKGGVLLLGTLPAPYDKSSTATAISDSGRIAGHGGRTVNEMIPFTWTSSEGIREFPRLGGTQAPPAGINDAGCVVGWSARQEPRQPRHAFLHDPRNGLHDLGPQPTTTSSAIGINNANWVVGGASLDTQSGADGHPVLWSPDGKMRDLGVIGEMTHGFAYSVNEANTVVGSVGQMRRIADGPRCNFSRPFIWTEKDGMSLLPCPQFDNVSAIKVNNSGSILLCAYDFAILGAPDFSERRTRSPRMRVDLSNQAGFLLEGGILYRLPEFPDGTKTTYVALNDQGELAGYATLSKPDGSGTTLVGFLATPKRAAASR
jgi:probable HAF family extracellular repeat protein